MFPEAGISMLVMAPETLSPVMSPRTITTSVLQKVAPRWVDHRWLLPLFPWAVRRMRVPDGTRLLVSSDAAVIKGLRMPPGCVQVCYCYSPPRYLWEMTDAYAENTSGIGAPGRWLFRKVVARVKKFDLEAAAGVAHYIADSRFVADRIRRHYGREATVVYPPVEVDRFSSNTKAGDYYLVVSELVGYKRVDLAVEACSRLGRKLVVVGDGAEAGKLRALAGPTVSLRGRLSDGEVTQLMEGCRAFLYPQIEDFGITAVEAQAAGRPVIALGIGGALETVIEGVTGCFFAEQTVESLMAAIERFEAGAGNISAEACRRNAERFSGEHFREEFRQALVTFGLGELIPSE
ncbi:MAG TPA: glycosyltransferase [Rariglobus sp.]|nr:glycosyltransferase [Rariglobus sp.]